jgi:hypothetical protein
MTRTLRTPNPSRTLTRAVLLALGLGALGASNVQAGPIGIQATGGWYTDSNDFFLGGGARVGFGSITVIPNAEYLFVDKASEYSLNVDGTMSVLPLGVASGYVGAGIGWMTVDPDNAKSSTDTVFNLIAGAGLNTFPLKPFGQFKYVLKDGDDPLQFAVGVRF